MAHPRIAARTLGPRRHCPLRGAHAFQGHGDALGQKTSPSKSTRSVVTSTPSPRRNTPATSSRCSTSTCRWPSRCSGSPGHRAGLRRRRNRAREEGRPRRNQDGRGHSRQSRARDLRRRLLAQPSAGDARFSVSRRRCRRSTKRPCGATSPTPTSPPTSSSRRSAISSTSGVRALIERAFSGGAGGAARAITDVTPATVAEVLVRAKDLRAEPRVLWHAGAVLRGRRSIRGPGAQHHARRLDELAAFPEHS